MTTPSYRRAIAGVTLACCVLLIPSPALAAAPCSMPDRVHVETRRDINQTATRTGLLSTITVAAPDEITSITFGTMRNAVVTVAGQHYTSGQTLTLPPGTTTVDVIVERASPSGGAFVPFVVHDRCGTWPSFIGAGAQAF
jgi:hypothetical protein